MGSRTRSTVHSLALLLALAGCAGPAPREPATGDWQQQLALLTALEDWQFTGKVAVSTPSGSESARLEWDQQGRRSELVLSGPVGWNRATVVSDGDRLRLQRDGEWQEYAVEDNRALEEQLGWPLPVQYLPYWVRGMPSPELSAEQLDIVDGRLRTLHQGGWRVEYRDYQDAEGLQLPARMQISREGVTGKLVLKSWQLGNAE